ncbi:MAG: hypothetical protein ACYCOU_08740 [Sulfobacillus sp.]
MWPHIPLAARGQTSPVIILTAFGIVTALFGGAGLWLFHHVAGDQDDNDRISKS